MVRFIWLRGECNVALGLRERPEEAYKSIMPGESQPSRNTSISIHLNKLFFKL